MSHNYEDMPLPDGMMGKPHEFSDGREQVDINKFHGSRMTAGEGSSQEAYPDVNKEDGDEVGSAGDHNGPEKEGATGTPRLDTGKRM